MKKKCNVIQINGLGGVALVIFLICCAATGFILFPAWCCMNLWNFIASFCNIPSMNIYSGGILWIILVLLFVVLHGNHQPVRFSSVQELNKDEIKRALDIIQTKQIENRKDKECEKDNSSNITKEN